MAKKGENVTLMYTVKVGGRTVYRERIPASQSARLDELEAEMKQKYPTASRQITEVGASSDGVRPRRAPSRNLLDRWDNLFDFLSGYGSRNGPGTV